MKRLRRKWFASVTVLFWSLYVTSSPARADTPLDGSTWKSDNCHFNEITFYSAVGATLNYKDDESLLGWQEPFSVDAKTYTVTIAPINESDEDNDKFTGLYSISVDGKLNTLVGYHFWRDDKGTHNERCSYTLSE